MVYSLTGLSTLGSITTESLKKEANVDNMPLPLSDSQDSLTFDFTGAQANLSLRGIQNAISVPALAALATEMKNLVSGNQSATKVYVSDLLGTFNVKIASVSIEYEGGVPLKFNYSLDMVHSSTSV